MLNWLLIIAMTWTTGGKLSQPTSSDPNLRMEELMITDGPGCIQYSTRCIWIAEPASHLTPVRVHGGLGP
jgi:hypothetical protein